MAQGDVRPTPLAQWRAHRVHYGGPALLAIVCLVLLANPLERVLRALSRTPPSTPPTPEDRFDPHVRLVEIELKTPLVPTEAKAQPPVVQLVVPSEQPVDAGANEAPDSGIAGARMDWVLDPTSAFVIMREQLLRPRTDESSHEIADTLHAELVVARAMCLGDPLDPTSPHGLALAADVARSTEYFRAVETRGRLVLLQEWQAEMNSCRVRQLSEQVVEAGVEPQ